MKYQNFMIIVFAIAALVTPTIEVSYSVDVGDPAGVQSVASWACARSEGFVRAIIECYIEGCSVHGTVAPSCLGNYRNAVAAGYKYIDLYFFPCTGAVYNCKSPQTQVNELVNFVNTNKMLVQTIWIDFEKDTNPNGCPDSWSADSASNLALAKQFTDAAKTTGWNWGIYSSQGEWETLFGSAGAVVDSSFKIWYAHYQTPPQPNYNDWNEIAFGGFSAPSGKQYGHGSGHCGKFDLDIFTYSTGEPE